MGFFPAIAIDNPFHIGDNVILEPLCSRIGEMCGRVYLLSDHSEMFLGHPGIQGKPRDWNVDDQEGQIRMIDVRAALRSLKDLENDERIILPNKLLAIYRAMGIPTEPLIKPTLYLTKGESDLARRFRLSFTGPVVGVVVESRYQIKSWPHTATLIRRLLKQDINVVAIRKPITPSGFRYLYEKRYDGLLHLTDQSLRKVMVYISAMDLLVGPDTGLLHIAGAFDVPTVVIGYDIWSDLYEPYLDCDFFGVDIARNNLKQVSAWSVWRSIKARLSN